MKGSPMTEKLYEYVIGTFANDERKLLAKMAKRAEKAGMPMIMIAEDQARFLRILLPAIGAQHALDVGTLFGYSAAIMAQAMGPAGRVVSLELEPDNAAIAHENLEHLGLGGQVEIQIGEAIKRMKQLESKFFDFVLIDADKGGYVDYFTEALRLVRPGGIIAADNTLAWGRVADKPGKRARADEVRAIQKFNQHVAKNRKVEACLLPIGDGLVVARVKD
jgi:caffeoyl-CoA O-methyltransferase